MEVKAVLRYIRTSPRKARLVADLIRGKNASDALNILAFTQKASARILEKLLKSAIANAEDAKEVKDVDSLTISQIRVDEGPVSKRHMPRARGRATPIKKRTSHITIVLK
ncbi:MAG: 50S ribosomal protein L22 [Nitrospinota bacterium]